MTHFIMLLMAGAQLFVQAGTISLTIQMLE